MNPASLSTPARLIVALTVLLAAPLGAQAFVPYTTDGGVPLAWPTDSQTVVIGADLPADLTEAGVERAVSGAFAAWGDQPCAPFSVTISGFEPSLVMRGDDRVNAILWEHDVQAWNARYGVTELARTLVTHRQVSGQIVDADMIVNVGGFVFSQTQTCGPDYDLQSTFTHEAGHFFGLDHSSQRSAVMFATNDPDDCGKRTLHADDIEGYCATYEEPQVADPGPSPDAGPTDVGTGAETMDEELVTMNPGSPDDCAGAPTGPPAWAWVVALLGILRRRRSPTAA